MSSSFTVELPTSIRPLLESEAREHGFDSAAAYLEALVRANAPADESDPELEAAIQAGLESGEPRPSDDGLWEEIATRAGVRIDYH